MSSGKTRATLYGVVGAYLLYMAYGLFQGFGNPDTTMKPAVQILFIVFFTAAGAGLLFFAIRIFRQISREESEQLEAMREERRKAEQSADSTDAPEEDAPVKAGDSPEADGQYTEASSDQSKGDNS